MQTPKYAITLSLAEIGLGSLLHAFHLPLAGHILSLNQEVVLIFAAKSVQTRKEAVSISNSVSTSAAFLKAFSPAGKILMPMLAISVQGVLFTTGLAFFGLNYVGILMASVFLSLWAFLQPLLFAYLLFGSTFFQGVQALWLELAKALHLNPTVEIWILCTAVFLKIFAAVMVAHFAWTGGMVFEERYLKKVEDWLSQAKLPKRKNKFKNNLLAACYDLLNPWFIVSLLLSVGFFYFSHRDNHKEIMLYAFRSVGAGFLFFWLLRALSSGRIFSWLKRYPGLHDLAAEVTRRLR